MRRFPFRAMTADGYLVYNVFVTNWAPRALVLDSAEVVDSSTLKPIVTYDRDALQRPFRQCSVLSMGGAADPANLTLNPAASLGLRRDRGA